jgi:hypothetical protein
MLLVSAKDVEIQTKVENVKFCETKTFHFTMSIAEGRKLFSTVFQNK